MAHHSGGTAVTDPIPSIETESTDRVFRALADVGRRATVAYVADAERPVNRDELVHHVAVETAAGGDGGRGGGHERLAARFHHQHLPQLEAAGLVDYDREAGVVRGTALADRVVRWFDRV